MTEDVSTTACTRDPGYDPFVRPERSRVPRVRNRTGPVHVAWSPRPESGGRNVPVRGCRGFSEFGSTSATCPQSSGLETGMRSGTDRLPGPLEDGEGPESKGFECPPVTPRPLRKVCQDHRRRRPNWWSTADHGLLRAPRPFPAGAPVAGRLLSHRPSGPAGVWPGSDSPGAQFSCLHHPTHASQRSWPDRW